MSSSAHQPTQYKFGNGAAKDMPWLYEDNWLAEDLIGTSRLTIAPREGQIDLMLELLEVMSEPMWLLYVLVVPRGEGEAGRYQSSTLQSREQVRHFLRKYQQFLEVDGRHNVWIRLAEGDGMLIYDRHNLIYAYGPLEEFASVLRRAGLAEVETEFISVPDPHSHHYHPDFDAVAHQLLKSDTWHHTPLRPQDKG